MEFRIKNVFPIDPLIILCEVKSKLIHKEVHSTLLFSPEVDLETNTGVQIIYFGGDIKKWGS